MVVRRFGLVVGLTILASVAVGCDQGPTLSETKKGIASRGGVSFGPEGASGAASGLTGTERDLARDLQSTGDSARRVATATEILNTSRKATLQLAAMQALAREKSGAQEIAAVLRNSKEPLVRLNAAGALLRIDTAEARDALHSYWQGIRGDRERAEVLQACAAFANRDDLAFLDRVIADHTGAIRDLARQARDQASAR